MSIRTCLPGIRGLVTHTIDLPQCCPVSGNPQPGSTLTVAYRPNGVVFPVEDLRDMITEYVGGHSSRNVRNMEEMIQDVAQRATDVTHVRVRVRADLRILPPEHGPMQELRMIARAKP